MNNKFLSSIAEFITRKFLTFRIANRGSQWFRVQYWRCIDLSYISTMIYHLYETSYEKN
ncbi:MAG: hypothetical protein JWP81_4900 [Ferruginibacter sp.]|nr:hypothetical protein [Ferruginibacter sp.]